MNIGVVIADLRFELNDLATVANPQGKRYDNAFLIRKYNQGIQLAYDYRKDLFQKTAIVQASQGDLQQPPGFDRVTKIDAITDACGNIIKRLNKVQPGTQGVYPKRCSQLEVPAAPGATSPTATCPTPDTLTMDSHNPNTFSFDPPVNGEVYYRVTGSVAPKPYGCDLTETLCLDPMINICGMHYAKFAAYQTESESSTSKGMAADSLKIFFNLLKIFKDEDQQACKEFCKK